MRSIAGGRAVFLDRDGTINVKADEGDYIRRPSELVLLCGASHAIRRFNDAGVLVVLVTNQRGIALGRFTEADLEEVHSALAHELYLTSNASVDAIFHCPHDLNQCGCRKPKPGMLQSACARFPEIVPGRSALVGDSASDTEAGQRFGVPTLQLGLDVPDLSAAADVILDTWGGGEDLP